MNRSLVGLGALLGMVSNLALAAPLISTNRFQFRLPQSAAYRLDDKALRTSGLPAPASWLKAWREDGCTNFAEFGDRVVLQLKSTADFSRLRGNKLRLVRVLSPEIFILQAPDAWTAMQEADRLAALAEVRASYPVIRRHVSVNSAYA